MVHTVVLRFSDFEVETIPVHQEIIKTGQPVWWGWWKKKHEPMQNEALEEIAKKCPIQIGLVNRTSREFFTARCTKVVFDPIESLLPSPNPKRTPNYYRESKHPAWFEFSSIEQIEYGLFKREFGRIPEGDPTLFLVDKEESGTTILPSLFVPQDVIETKGDSILHLSDLHFGGDHDFPIMQRDDPILELPLATIISNHIKSLPNCHIGVVVISGDIITKGNANDYPHAHKFLESLMNLLGLQKDHIVIVPGNHDIWLKEIENPTREYQPEEPFRIFLRAFYGADIKEIERLWVFHTPGGWNLSFLGLNSARPRRKETMDYGYVGVDRYEPWLQRIAKNNYGKSLNELVCEKRLNFVVLHHHILPAGLVCMPEVSRPVSLTLDAGELVAAFQKYGIHFVLHGHQHVPFVGSTSRARLTHNKWTGYDQPLFIIGGGSSGAKKECLWDEMRNNTFGIYTPRPDGLHIQMEEFNKTTKPETFMDLLIPFK